MATIQEPEILFAQRLAANEKPIRTKAIQKLRKYITVRSQKVKGGFTGDELLKLWKGLFYCLWMQDKPLLQEELSNQISGLLNNFQNVDSQFLFLESFLQTVKREWTGIDRLRMDKFFQLVRFVFRQGFEMLKRKKWETSLVGRFLELLTAQVLQSSSAAPCGLQLHILDLYMTELAGVGSAELTADQSLTFIEPFCKTAAKTKDRMLLKAICSSIFGAIIDQAPFAIEDLMREMKAGGPEDSDSGQASDEEEEKEITKTKPSSKKSPKRTTGKQINGTKSNEDDDDDDDDDDDELLHLEDDSDTELPAASEIGPVLQFDYGALANKLFELASRSHTPSHNRQKLYRIIKILRDLSEGIFPQDEYPEEVSTDEDDDEMFGSRKRMKRGRGLGEEEDKEEGGPATKKRKGKKKETKPGEASKGIAKDDNEPAESTGDNKKKRKKKKKKKRAGEGTSASREEHTEGSEEVNSEESKATVVVSFVETDTEKSTVKDTETVPEPTEAKTEQSPPVDSTEAGDKEDKMETTPSVPEKASSVKVTEEVSPMETGVKSQTPQPSEEAVEDQTSVTVTEEPSQPEPQPTEDSQKEQLESLSTKKSEVDLDVSEPSVEVSEAVGEQAAPITQEELAGEQPAPVTQEGDARVGEMELGTPSETDTTTTQAKKKSKRKGLKVERKAEEVADEAGTITVDLTLEPTPAEEPVNLEVSEAGVAGMEAGGEDPVHVIQEADAEVEAAEPEVTRETVTTTTTPAKKKSKRKSLKAEKKAEVVEGEAQVEIVGGVTEVDLTSADDCTTAPLEKKTKKKKGKQEVDLTQEEEAVVTTVDLTLEATPAEEPANSEVSQCNVDITEAGGEQDAVTPEGDVVVIEVEPETTPESEATTTPAKKKSKRKSVKAEKKVEGEAQVKVVGESMEADLTSTSCETVVVDATITPLKKKTKKKNDKQEVDLTQEEEAVTMTVDLTLESTHAEEPANSEVSEPSVDAKTTSETDSTAASAKRKSKRKSLKAEKNPEEVGNEAKVEEVDLTSVDCEASVEDTNSLKKTKNKKYKREKETTEEEETKTFVDLTLGTAPVEEPAADNGTTRLLKKKKKKNQKAAKTEELMEAAVEETPPEADAKELPSEIAMVTPVRKNKKKQRAAASQESEVEGQTQSEEAGVAVGETPAEESRPESAGLPSSEKKVKKKKKRKIPVVFEFEADELVAAEEDTMINGLAEEETTAKKAKLSSEPSTPLITKKSQKKKAKAKAGSGVGSDFITFQRNTSIPKPLFCKTKGGPSTPLSSKKKFHTPRSESKKVTFGLKNNKTAEFRKTDRSLLVSPDGSSRVPFDPEQKPKFGVLKSPARSLTGRVKKTPKVANPPKTQKTTPKGRPTAADFF